MRFKRTVLGILLATCSLIAQKPAIGATRTIVGDESKYMQTQNREAASLYNQALAELYQQNNVQNAIKLFTKALELDPQFVEALDNLGTCYRRTGDFEKALSCYKQSSEILPHGTVAHMNMAVVYSLQKRYDLAIAEYNTIKELEPSNPESYYGISEVSNRKGDYETAIFNAKIAMKLYQEANSSLLGDAELQLATAYQGSGDNVNAKIWADKSARDKAPMDSEIKKILPDDSIPKY